MHICEVTVHFPEMVKGKDGQEPKETERERERESDRLKQKGSKSDGQKGDRERK